VELLIGVGLWMVVELWLFGEGEIGLGVVLVV